METKTYKGSCHCGAVRFTVNTDLENVIECNCSHCERKGLLLAFVPKSEFTLESGEDNLNEYLFNKKQIQHPTCKTCGVQPFGYGKNSKGEETAAINVRCLEDVDIKALNIKPFDGKNY